MATKAIQPARDAKARDAKEEGESEALHITVADAEDSREKKDQRHGLRGVLGALCSWLLRQLRVIISFFKPGRDMSVGSRRLKVVRLLAEGGFSFVYLVEHAASGERFAVKQVLCGEDDQVCCLRSVRPAVLSCSRPRPRAGQGD